MFFKCLYLNQSYTEVGAKGRKKPCDMIRINKIKHYFRFFCLFRASKRFSFSEYFSNNRKWHENQIMEANVKICDSGPVGPH